MNVIFDIETYPQFFSAGFLHMETGEKLTCEYSFRRNDLQTMIAFFGEIIKSRGRLIGFNNVGFDYPVIHHLIKNQEHVTPDDLYNKAMEIISSPWEDRFRHVIWDQDTLIPQVDLLKIHHFDNVSRFTSLKTLEFNMRRPSVEDLPFAPGTILNWQQYDKLVEYMWEDIDATAEFYQHSKEMIAFRDTMTEKYGRNFTNDNDTKIGKEYFIMKMQQEVAGFDKKQQTIRNHIRVADIVFPYITFDEPEFNRVLRYFKDQVIFGTDLKGVFKDVSCTINGFTFDFGAGGIHGSVESCIVESDSEYIVEDWDVASYYPNIAIANDLHPEHLGASFCQIYRDVYEQRKLYPKGSVENAALKLALNGVYGDSNNQYSCFYDPQYTLSITINGQLMLCMLAEKLMLGGCQMIQINTDGLTVQYPRHMQPWTHEVAAWWEKFTRLTLEHVEYKKMYIRDVNSYIGEYHSGKLKRIGAYAHETPLDDPQTREIGWYKDHSALVVPKAAEACLVRGVPVRQFIESHDNPLDFLLRAKVNRNSSLITVDYQGDETEQQNTTRYYISCIGEDLVKIMPPLKGKMEPRRFNINKGWKVTVCNRLKDLIEEDIDHEWYIAEAEKLTRPLLGGM